MDAVVAAIRDRKRQDGTATLAYGSRAELLAHFCQLLDFGRRLEILDHVVSVFARHPHHKIPYEDPAEDMAGKAIPEYVLAQLDARIHLIGEDFTYGDMAPDVVKAMLRTVYILLRDTGRRPWEVRWLRMDCLEAQDREYILIWDNHKARRNRRRLEIGRETAFAIQEWLAIRRTLKVPARSRTFLSVQNRPDRQPIFRRVGGSSVGQRLTRLRTARTARPSRTGSVRRDAISMYAPAVVRS
ncbi:hypothetical protein AB0D14_42535 [Streptomyces sp. NPDC048484]|uniref:hypothetical protein n=1 Tax=Streptomyces sp. NPDC048484 TaxID=3155146 RepID=UPI00343A1FFB